MGEKPGRVFTASPGVSFMSNIIQQPDGLYVEFHSSGRSRSGTIIFSDTDGAVIEIGCLAGTEQYHVLTDDEKTLVKHDPGATGSVILRSSTDERLPHQSLSFRRTFRSRSSGARGHRGITLIVRRHIAPDFDRSAGDYERNIALRRARWRCGDAVPKPAPWPSPS